MIGRVVKVVHAIAAREKLVRAVTAQPCYEPTGVNGYIYVNPHTEIYCAELHLFGVALCLASRLRGRHQNG